MQVTKSANIERRSETSLGHLFSRRHETAHLKAFIGACLEEKQLFSKENSARRMRFAHQGRRPLRSAKIFWPVVHRDVFASGQGISCMAGG